jgi:hypothetical protein
MFKSARKSDFFPMPHVYETPSTNFDKRNKFDHHSRVHGKGEKFVSTHSRSDNQRMCTAYNYLLSNDAIR